GRAAAFARTRARRCAGWGSWHERLDQPRGREPRPRLGGVRAQGVRGPPPPRRDRDRGGRGPRARLGPLDLRRAAVDPHDHRSARRDPGGDRARSPPTADTTPGETLPRAGMVSRVGSLADNKAALARRYA